MTAVGNLSRNGTLPIQRGGWLDLLRFVAAFLIILYHFQFAAPVPYTAFPDVFQRGYLVTDFFLIDSGYVLGRIYAARVSAGRMSLGDFFRKRFLRVVPLHLIALMGLVAMVVAAGAASVSPLHPVWFEWRELPGELFLLQAFGVPGGHGWNTPTWSLSALMGCYLLFPFMARMLARLPGGVALLAAALVFATADAAAIRFLGYPIYYLPLSFGFLRAVPLFLAGVALARFSETVYAPPRVAALVGLAAAAALAGIQALGEYNILSLALICVIILAAAAVPLKRPSQLIAHAALASFSMYISNEIVRIGWFGAVRVLGDHVKLSVAAQWALWGGGVAAALLCAFALYAWVDAPTQRWLSGLKSPAGGRSWRLALRRQAAPADRAGAA